MRVIPLTLLLAAAAVGAFHGPAHSTEISSTVPAQNQINVGRATNVTASFDTLLSAATVNDTTFLVYSFETGKLTGSRSLANGDSAAVFDPALSLRAGEVIEVIVTTDIRSAGGTPLDTAYVWRFTAEAVDNGESLNTYPLWLSASPNVTKAVALGDYDNDGDLDAAFGNHGVNAVYRNDGGTITTAPVWTSSAANSTADIAWADYDGDGDLDLACGNTSGQANTIYRNDAGSLTASPVWSSTPTNQTLAVAWGDYDGDGDLDLACGNLTVANTLYRNDAGTLTTSPVWSSTTTNETTAIAWGDFDGDGDLDLACGNYAQSNAVYRNDAGVLTTSPVWSSTPTNETFGVAWGDYDGDGDLELACGNYNGQANTVYRNDAGVLTTSPVWSSTATNETFSVAWGDYDGDGDLELACGNTSGQANTVYRNDAGTLTSSPAWSSDSTYNTNAIAWGDMDDDGDLDLVCANDTGQPNTVLYNMTQPQLTSTNPGMNGLDVSRSADIEATFDRAMEPGSFADTSLVVNSYQTGRLSGGYSLLTGDTTAVFGPDSLFHPGETLHRQRRVADHVSTVAVDAALPYVGDCVGRLRQRRRPGCGIRQRRRKRGLPK
jgi:hypothetical protein